jgi:WD40 repeat protein
MEPACLAVLLGHKASLCTCAFSPKGDRIVSGDANGIVKVWDSRSGEELLTAGTAGGQLQIRTCRFSPDGTRIDVAFDNDVVQCWDAATGSQLSFFDPARSDLTLLGISPHGTRAVAADTDGMVWLWEIPSGEQIVFLGERKHSGPWMFSPDGSRIIARASGLPALNLFSAVTGTLIATLPNTDYPVAFSRRSERLAAKPITGTVRVWDTADGREIAADLNVSGSKISAYALKPDGRHLAAISTEGDLTIVDARSGRNLATVDAHESGMVNGCLFSPNGDTLLSWDQRNFKLWDVAAGEEPVVFEGPSAGLATCSFSPDGMRIVSCGNDRALRIWDATQRPALSIRAILPGRVLFSDFSPDGKTLLHAAGNSLVVWDAETLAERNRNQVSNRTSSEIQDCAWTPDGARVVVAADNEVTLWSDGNMLLQLQHQARVEACAISPNGDRIVSCDVGRRVSVWDASTGQLIGTGQFQEQGGPLTALAFSTDGAMIVAATALEIKVIDTATGVDIAKLRGLPGRLPIWANDPGLRLVLVRTAEEGGYDTRDALTGAEVETHGDLRFAAFEPTGSPFREILQRNMTVSPDGTCLARWGLRLELCHLRGPQPHMILEGHDGLIYTCRFSRDGAYLASVSEDETLRIWEVATGRELNAYWAEAFTSCAWSLDGRTLIAGTQYGGVHVLQLDGPEIVSAEPVSQKTRVITGLTAP